MSKAIRGMLGLSFMSLRGLRQRKARTILIIVGVMVGVAAMISVSITNETAQRTIQDTFGEAAGDADFIITNATASIGDTPGFDAGMLAEVRNTPGVKLAAPLLQLTTSSSSELEDWEYNFYVASINGTLLFGIEPEASGAIGHYRIVSGNDLGTGSAPEALVSQSYADSLDIGPGDILQLAVPGGLTDFHVTGLINSSGLTQLNSGKVVLANLDFVASITGRQGRLDQIDVVATGNVDQQQLKEELTTFLGPAYNVSLPETKGEQTDDVALLIATGLSFNAMMVAAIGVFLIYNTFATAMAERRREMGLMRAIGAGKGQLMGIVLGEACLLGAIGTILGIPLGIGLARGLGRIIEETTMTPMNDPTLLPEHILFAFIVGFGIALLASLIPAIQSGRLSPMEALAWHRDNGRSRSRGKPILGAVFLGTGMCIFVYHLFGNSNITFSIAFWMVLISTIGITLLMSEYIPLLENIISRLLCIFGPSGEIGGHNLARKPARSALTAGILVIGVASIILVGGVRDSQRKYNGQFMDRVAGSDFFIFSPQPFPLKIIDDINAMPGVDKATGIGDIPTNMIDPRDGDKVAGIFLALDPSVHYGNWWNMAWVEIAGSSEEALAMVESGSAVFVESYTAEHYGLGVGDSITLETLKGRQSFDIAAITYGRTMTGFAVLGSWEQAEIYFGTTDAGHGKVILEPGYDISMVESDIMNRWGQTYHLKIEHYDEYYDRMMRDLDESSRSADVMQLIAIVIVALAITNTLLMNVLERRRELGMLRAVGMTRKQVLFTITAEGISIGLLGGIIGTILGVLALPTVVDSWDSMLEVGIEYPTVFSYQIMAVSMGIAVVVSIIASLLPAWNGANTNIAEAMRTE